MNALLGPSELGTDPAPREATCAASRDGTCAVAQGVLVAEPRWLLRKGLVAVVGQIASCHVVGEADTGARALDGVRLLQPDLLLLSLGIAEPDATEVVLRLRERGAMPRVLVLSQQRAEAGARDALRAGCDGFIDPERGGEVLEQAIREVAAGRPFLDPQVSRRLLLGGDEPDARSHDALSVLTERERTVFAYIAAGHTNRSAGAALHISEKTVEKHRALFMQKLKLRSVLELRRLAMDLRLTQHLALGVERRA